MGDSLHQQKKLDRYAACLLIVVFTCKYKKLIFVTADATSLQFLGICSQCTDTADSQKTLNY